jgi:LysR family transcriptional activator of nhaA
MKKLNYHHLYYFWRIAVTGKLTEVAQELHVSQSALSAQIKQLEHQTDTQLFYREGRKLILTEEGKRVLSYAQDIFSKGEELEQLFEKGFHSSQQHLSIGVLSNLSRNFIERFITPLLENPQVSFSLITKEMKDLLNGLVNHEFDLVLTNRPVLDDPRETIWQSKLLTSQPLAIVGPAAQQPSASFPSGYQEAEWVLPEKNTEIRSAFESYCATWQYLPNVKAETNDMAMLRLLARDSGAFAVTPEVVVKDEIEQGLLKVYMHLPNTHENFYAITTQRKYISPLLVQLLKDPNWTI